MKTIKLLMAGLAIVAFGLPAMASGENEGPKPLKSGEMVNANIYDEIDDLRLNDFKLTDETVDIYFTINSEGKVILDEVSGKNCMVTTYITQMLTDKQISVVSELQNVKHHIKVRYVVI